MNDLEWVRHKLTYCPCSGEIRHRKTGKLAGCTTPRGYRSHFIRGRSVLAQSVAWLLMRGQWPPAGKVIDHIDRDPLNNAWSNLRLVSKQTDNLNRRIHKSNTTGYRGVSRHRYGFEASIKRNGRKYFLGTYPTPEEASETHNTIAEVFEKMQQLSDSMRVFDQIRNIAVNGLCLTSAEKELTQ